MLYNIAQGVKGLFSHRRGSLDEVVEHTTFDSRRGERGRTTAGNVLVYTSAAALAVGAVLFGGDCHNEEVRPPGVTRPDGDLEKEVEILRQLRGGTGYGVGYKFSSPKVIRNDDYWNYFRRFLGMGEFDVDFSKNMLLYCSLVETSGGHYSIEFSSLNINDATLTAKVHVITPSGAQTCVMGGMLYHLVEIPKHEGRIVFEYERVGDFNKRAPKSIEFLPMTSAQEKAARRQKVLGYVNNLQKLLTVELTAIPPADWEKWIGGIVDDYHEDALPGVRDYIQKRGMWGYTDLIYHLGNVRDEKAVPILVQVLKNPDERQCDRWAAASSLGMIKAKESIPALIDVIEEVQGKIDGATGLTKHGLNGTRSLCLSALKSITGNDLGYDFDKWRNWYKENNKNDLNQN